MAQSERREAILYALYMRRHDTMGNLAHEFGVSRQTILSDINVLSLDHPEIEIRPGRWGGGVYIKNGFRSDRKYLKPEEKELLMSLRNQLDEKKKVIMDGLLKRLAI